MGSPKSESKRSTSETQHKVTLTKPFEMGVYEVTQSEFEQVMGVNPSNFKGSSNPVEKVSWHGAELFCRLLSELPKERAAGHVYRLPTEAEWEYACRAGTTTVHNFGRSSSRLPDYAWFSDNSGETTHPVGQKKANRWGLYDMHGNVWEWCQDWDADLPRDSQTDPQGPTMGTKRTIRGGGWYYQAPQLRSAYRGADPPGYSGNYLGFRVVRERPR